MKNLWGGRFNKEMHPLLKCFSYSLSVDWELLDVEIQVNEAWVKMLKRIGVLTQAEAHKLGRGLWQILGKLKNIENDRQAYEKCICQYEDIHTLIQSALEKQVGAVANKIHTGRSRNDLVVTSTRLYLKGKIAVLQDLIQEAQGELVKCAKRAGEGIISGVTHLRKAQPVLMGHHLMAYVEMMEEDLARLRDVYRRVDVLPLGSAALAGSGIPVDQKFLAKELGFSKITSNSLASVSDRAFIVEIVSSLSILWMHLSRLAEDFILWNSEFIGFIELDDAFATGSSLMPQKKNPDVFELIRGRAGVMFGELISLLTLQKGLPLGYHRDLQEDKPGVFRAIRRTELTLCLLAHTLRAVSFQPKNMRKSVEDDNLFATDILDYLVRKGVAFSEAHRIVGQVVRYASETDKILHEISLKEWKSFCKKFEKDVRNVFNPLSSVKAKKTIGSTHPAKVRSEIAKWGRLLQNRSKQSSFR